METTLILIAAIVLFGTATLLCKKGRMHASKMLLPLLLFLFVLPNEASAEVHKFKTTDFAYRTCDDDGDWSNWSDWEESSMLVVINIDEDEITIYSNETQEFDIYEYEGTDDSDKSDITMTMNCVDTDGLRCQIRLRTYEEGEQLYVDYNNIMYVYNLEAK